MTRNEIINKYALDVSVSTLERLDEIVRLENIKNDWDQEKYISFDVVDNNTRKINFWGSDENIIFERVGTTNYFKAVL